MVEPFKSEQKGAAKILGLNQQDFSNNPNFLDESGSSSSEEESEGSEASIKSQHIVDELRLPHPERNKLVISVTDTGIGIKKEDQPKIFQLFGKL